MQRLSADFIRVAQGWNDIFFRCIQPYSRLPFDFTFPFRVLFVGAFHALQGHRIHLGDAALSSFLVLFRFLGARHMTVTACGLDVLFPNNFYQWMIRRTLPYAVKVICISKATAAHVRRSGVAEEKISILPCGIFFEGLSSFDDPHNVSPSLITIGRLIPRKGVAWFLSSVFPQLRKKYPGMTYDIVGEGPERKTIERICREYAFGNAVRMHGAVTEKKKAELLSRADLFVMPNVPIEGDMEGFGTVCIEASSRGVPVVAARLEGIEDAVVEGRTGFFFHPRDGDSCVQAICRALDAPLDRQMVFSEAEESFSWEMLSAQWKHVIFSAS